MESKPTNPKRRQSGFTLAEMLVGLGVASLFTLGTVAFYCFCMTSFASMSNYADFNNKSRNASDVISKDIRSAPSVASATTNQVVLTAADGTNVTYFFDASGRSLTRTKGSDVRTVLTNADLVVFALYQRPLTNGAYNQFPTATATNAKLVAVKWSCSRAVAGVSRVNSEDAQSAIISLRNE
jgi:prepilin-type N-terminal cleavage/methylation domain-containing protein